MSKIRFVEFKKTDGELVSIRPYSVTAVAAMPSGATEILVLGAAKYVLNETYKSVLEDLELGAD